MTGRWRRSTWHGPLLVVGNLLTGLRRDDGTVYMTRWQYLRWVWRTLYRKALAGPVRCALGWHRIGPASDTGIGGCGFCDGGTMDIWCLDCDAALSVPIDDVLDWPKAQAVLEMWQAREQGMEEPQ